MTRKADEKQNPLITLWKKFALNSEKESDAKSDSLSNSQKVIELLNEIGKDIITKHSVENIVTTVYENINQLMDAPIFALGVYNEYCNGLDFWGINHESQSMQLGFEPMLDPSRWSVYCFKEQKEVFVSDGSKPQTHYFSKVLFAENDLPRLSFIYLPLTFRKKKKGVLCVQSLKKNSYNKLHLTILRNLANYISVALENADAYKEIQQQKEAVLAKTEELRVINSNLEGLVKERTKEIEDQRNEIEEQSRILTEYNKKLEMLSIVATQTNNAIMIMDAQGDILWLNDCFTRLYGYNFEQFVAARGSNIRQTSFNPEIHRTLERCIREKQPVVYEANNVMLTGESVWTQTTLTPIFDEKGEIINLVTIDSDITKHKNYEREILSQNAQIQAQSLKLQQTNNEMKRLSIIAQQAKNAIMVLDAYGDILWTNDYFTSLYGYTLEEFVEVRGRNILKTSFNPNIKAIINECTGEKHSVVYDAKNINKNGEAIWTQTTMTPILDENGEISQLVTVDADITDRKSAESKIKRQHRNITDSLNYASKIQYAILPPIETITDLNLDCFIFYQPKDIVSGDFYWIKVFKKPEQEEPILVIAVGDCTGHGVPGALMSMLGISVLNDTISKNSTSFDPGEILNELRKKVKKSLNHNGRLETKDGMDISLAVIDLKSLRMQFAAANSPAFIFRNGDLNELLADRMPIGAYVNDKVPFRTSEFQLKKNDWLYLFTDGFYSQFSGENGEKFKKSRFKNLLASTSFYNGNSQLGLIESKFTEWKGSGDQIDDVMIMGIKF